MKKAQLLIFSWDEIEYISYWVPSHGLCDAVKALKDGKKAVFIGYCGCGCWTKEMEKNAQEMVTGVYGEDGPIYLVRGSLAEGHHVFLFPKEVSMDGYMKRRVIAGYKNLSCHEVESHGTG